MAKAASHAGRRRRNERRWYEDDDLAVLQKGDGTVALVRVIGMRGDTHEGEVIYTVCEVRTRQTYPASDRGMRPTKDRAEADALLLADADKT